MMLHPRSCTVRITALCVVVLAALVFVLQWYSLDHFPGVTFRPGFDEQSPFEHGARLEPDFTAGNATLGFQALLALSQGTKWRVDGLRAAAHVSGVDVQVPPQPGWSEPFIKAFEEFGPVEAHGAAMAWLGHLDLLKFVILSGWGSALIMEDDMDWDVNIRKQTPLIAKAVRKLTRSKRTEHAPYGLEWDILWMGHCSDPPHDQEEGTFVKFDDDSVAPIDVYQGLNPHIKDVVRDGERLVQWSVNPVCTFAYAVTWNGARKLLQHASLGKGGAFDLMLMGACQEGILKCVSVNPEVFDPYNPAEGASSEVRAGDGGGDFNKDVGKVMGQTNNILHSARCNALFHSDCL